MAEAQQTATRWEPVAGIPETPCYDFAIRSPEMGRLSVRLKYSSTVGNDGRDLVLDFREILAFRSHWDGDGIPEFKQNPTFLSKDWTWPLLIVENSEWLGSADFSISRFIAEAGTSPRALAPFPSALLATSP